MNVNNVIQEVETVYRMISTINVSGDAIDVMAAARAKLRRIKEELMTPQEPVKEVSED